jgi:hypothetical protein
LPLESYLFPTVCYKSCRKLKNHRKCMILDPTTFQSSDINLSLIHGMGDGNESKRLARLGSLATPSSSHLMSLEIIFRV